MEERMYSKEEVMNYMIAAVYGYTKGIYKGLIGSVVIAGVGVGIGVAVQKIREHALKKKLNDTIDDFKEYVAEMD